MVGASAEWCATQAAPASGGAGAVDSRRGTLVPGSPDAGDHRCGYRADDHRGKRSVAGNQNQSRPNHGFCRALGGPVSDLLLAGDRAVGDIRSGGDVVPLNSQRPSRCLLTQRRNQPMASSFPPETVAATNALTPTRGTDARQQERPHGPVRFAGSGACWAVLCCC